LTLVRTSGRSRRADDGSPGVRLLSEGKLATGLHFGGALALRCFTAVTDIDIGFPIKEIRPWSISGELFSARRMSCGTPSLLIRIRKHPWNLRELWFFQSPRAQGQLGCAVSPLMFQRESQSTTSGASKTGQPYVHH